MALERQDIEDLLVQITDLKLENLSHQEFEKHLGKESPAQKLWDLLCLNYPKKTGKPKCGIGFTTASKTMALKRPNLIPIQDSVVDEVISRSKTNAWHLWWQSLSGYPSIVDRAAELRQVIQMPGQPTFKLSTLRTLDIVLWTYGKDQ